MPNKITYFIFVLIVAIVPAALSQPETDPLFTNQQQADHIAIVDKVISTDTLYLKTGEKVQLIGLKAMAAAPKKEKERDQFGFIIKTTSPVLNLEEQALTFVKSLVEGKTVRLEFDSKKRGPYQILLAYVYLNDNGLFINEEILRLGYASFSLAPPNFKYGERLRAAYQEARREQRGMHRQ